jgi:hypothetical protein
MPITASVENHFTEGLKTEYTGLNFPTNAATDTDNCVYTIVGDVTRRAGINTELNGIGNSLSAINVAMSHYKWNNAGGDGLTQVLVEQVGGILYFYKSSSATIAAPLSTTKLASTVTLSSFQASGSTANAALTECQYADGNGYLFVFHPNLEPFYCTYNADTIVANVINVQIRDFVGIPEVGVSDSLRPLTLSAEHQYNLQNQGWSANPSWTAIDNRVIQITNGTNNVFTVASGIAGIVNGQVVTITASDFSTGGAITWNGGGTVVGYSSTNLTIAVTGYNGGTNLVDNIHISVVNTNQIGTWFTQLGNYPSNSDVWWEFKNSSGVFAPGTTAANVTLNAGEAPRGYYILSAFNQNRSGLSGVAGLTNVSTTVRPKTGTWFQGRIWYSGVDASFPASGDAPFSTWSENIYFSQIITDTNNFGRCYQNNDPTSETLFDLLPSDGGVIQIQGCGSIYKLFPMRFGLLVFAANGVWFLGGSGGIGFTANDYAVTKIASIRSISSTSFVDVSGFPLFWNNEGIYYVAPQGEGSGSAHSPDIALNVTNICVGTILSFYNEIPLLSKKYVRGDYDPINYIVQWCYRDTDETGIADRYKYNRVLNFNTVNKSFYPWTIGNNNSKYISDIKYIQSPGGTAAPDPIFKYIVTDNAGTITFAEEGNLNYVDFGSVNYESYFVTGFKLTGQGQRRFQLGYVYIFSNNPTATQYKIQCIMDYANNPNSGKYSSVQLITNNNGNYKDLYHRHRLRGRGLAAQIKLMSVDGQPFDIIGWSVMENVNVGV